VAQQSTAEAE